MLLRAVYRELQRERAWSRIHLVPLLLAESDRDIYRREQAALAREREIMKDVPGWEVSLGPRLREELGVHARAGWELGCPVAVQEADSLYARFTGRTKGVPLQEVSARDCRSDLDVQEFVSPAARRSSRASSVRHCSMTQQQHC